MTKKSGTKKRRQIEVKSPTEIIAKNREIDNNIEIILTYQLVQKLVDIRNNKYTVNQAEAVDLFEIVFVIRKLSEYIKTTKLKTQAEAIEILDEYIEESNILFERLNDETKNYNKDQGIIELVFPEKLINDLYNFYTANINSLLALLTKRQVSVIYTNTITEIKNSIRYAINCKNKTKTA